MELINITTVIEIYDAIQEIIILTIRGTNPLDYIIQIDGWENFFIFIIYAAYLHIILGGDENKNKDNDKNKDNPPPPPKDDKK